MNNNNEKNNPIIVIDLDGTILERNFVESLRLYLLSSPYTGRIMPAVSEALHHLDKISHLVAVTARCVRGKKNTDKWLAREGLGFITSIHSPCFLTNEPARVEFKTRAITEILRVGGSPCFGIGDRGSDLDAYMNTNLFPIMVSSKPGKRLASVYERIKARGLKEGEDFLLCQQDHGGKPMWETIPQLIEERI